MALPDVIVDNSANPYRGTNPPGNDRVVVAPVVVPTDGHVWTLKSASLRLIAGEPADTPRVAQLFYRILDVKAPAYPAEGGLLAEATLNVSPEGNPTYVPGAAPVVATESLQFAVKAVLFEGDELVWILEFGDEVLAEGANAIVLRHNRRQQINGLADEFTGAAHEQTHVVARVPDGHEWIPILAEVTLRRGTSAGTPSLILSDATSPLASVENMAVRIDPLTSREVSTYDATATGGPTGRGTGRMDPLGEHTEWVEEVVLPPGTPITVDFTGQDGDGAVWAFAAIQRPFVPPATAPATEAPAEPPTDVVSEQSANSNSVGAVQEISIAPASPDAAQPAEEVVRPLEEVPSPTPPVTPEAAAAAPEEAAAPAPEAAPPSPPAPAEEPPAAPPADEPAAPPPETTLEAPSAAPAEPTPAAPPITPAADLGACEAHLSDVMAAVRSMVERTHPVGAMGPLGGELCAGPGDPHPAAYHLFGRAATPPPAPAAP